MIDDFLFCDWDEAPEEMSFEMPYGTALDRCVELVETLRRRNEGSDPALWPVATELYLLAPAILNVILNYRICVDLGLPLHPTEYFEVNSASRGSLRYPPEQVAEARKLLVTAIGLARAAYRLDPAFREALESFRRGMPPFLEGFVYSSRRDKYTWRGAEPAKVRALAASVLKGGRPSLAVGAAHGSIMAGLFLAELLGCELWFLRFSMFKRNDTEPVICSDDEAYIASFGDGSRILVFDEDSASGTTLGIFVNRLRAMAPALRSGVVIRHATSTFVPDHVGRTWWD